MAALSFVIALYLRLGGDTAVYRPHLMATYVLSLTLIAAVIYRLTGLYRGIWRFASVPDLYNIARAVTLTILIFLPVMFVLTRLEALPRSTLLINWFVLVALLGAPRLAYRLFKDRGLDHVLERAKHQTVPVLLISAKEGADTFIREMVRNPRAVYRVVGVLSDTASRVGREIYRVPVLGTIDSLEDVVAKLDRRGKRPQKLIITVRNLPGDQVRRLLKQADALAIPLARLPKLTDFQQNLNDSERSSEHVLEPIALEDLLGRPQAVLDRAAMSQLIRGRRVLVTGAGGTIGAELSRQIAAICPSLLVLIENSEFALYTIDMELRERFPEVATLPLLRDVRDRAQIDAVLAAERPEIVFHAAALKHLPIVEANPVEGVLTNVAGTRNVAEAARAFGVSTVVMISTDKAVNPTSVMGASKRIAESLCQALDLHEARRTAGATRYVTVRFGNVLGSTGSVVPLFSRQLAAGGPLTVTHPEVTRFFMTVREAVELVLQAAALSPGAETADLRGKICVLDMGEPVKIVDLAEQMIRLAGLRPDRDVKIAFVGLRPGEKLHEELFHPDEPLIPTSSPAIRLAAPRTADYGVLARSIDELEDVARSRREERMMQLLERLVPEYQRRRAAANKAIASRG
ncbi:MAG: polysaccharide biosynthesis protein [Alphaproteobacteria bacterium]|nr:polysaccharide biosynthesis protein [Alphaproteobacteria bacterium]